MTEAVVTVVLLLGTPFFLYLMLKGVRYSVRRQMEALGRIDEVEEAQAQARKRALDELTRLTEEMGGYDEELRRDKDGNLLN